MLLKIYSSPLWYIFSCFYTLTDGKTLFSSTGKSVNKCGNVSTRGGRIVGGEEAYEGEFPWITSLTSSIGHFCSSFVISDRHLISAAHCFTKTNNTFLDFSTSGEVNLDSFKVNLGQFSLQSPERVAEVAVSAEKLILHPDYQSGTKENDIAIIQLKESGISVHPGVIPICLPDTENKIRERILDKKITKAVSLGWGKIKHDQSYWNWVINTDRLKKVNVELWSSQACAEQYAFYRFPSKGYICAGEKYRTSCSGDSGGPLQVLSDENKWIAIGVTSAGSNCGLGGKPAIYSDISAHLEWIYEQIL